MKKRSRQRLRSAEKRGRGHLDAVNASRRSGGAPPLPEQVERFTDWGAGAVDVLKVESNAPAPPTPLATDQGYVEQRGNNIIAFFDDNWKPTREAFATRARLWYPDGRVQLLALDPSDTTDVARTPREVILPDTESA